MTDEVVKGLNDLLKDMEALPYTIQRKIIAKSLRVAAGPIREEAASLAPDDPETPGSRIAEAMSISVNDQTYTGAVARIGPSKYGFMGIFAEEGSKHQRKTPFLGPAFDSQEDRAYGLLADDLGDRIVAAFQKGNG
jgi:HK97 gp10 family phage protein